MGETMLLKSLSSVIHILILAPLRSLVCCLILFPLLLSPTLVMAEERPANRKLPETRATGPVLLVDGGDVPEADAFYINAMNSIFGDGKWDRYDLADQGLPNPPELLLGILRQYQAVVWHTTNTSLLASASEVLGEYVQPLVPGSPAGRLLLVAPTLYQVNLHPYFRNECLGLHNENSPIPSLHISAGQTALSFSEDLFDLEASSYVATCTGVQALEGTEVLYQMEYCVRCYASRPPYDPIVGVRQPARQVSTYARAITLTVPMQQFDQGSQAIRSLITYHLGIVPTSSSSGGPGKVHLSVNNAGYVGNYFTDESEPSLIYPYPGHVEHLHQAGIWVGARKPDGTVHVSTSSDHYSGLPEANERREFGPTEEPLRIMSSDPTDENYDPEALAPWQVECSFHDLVTPGETGDHEPLGLKVLLRAMAWGDYPIDDGVVLEYRIINESGAELRDVYVGFFYDATVGNTMIRDPYGGDGPAWNWYDDINGGWRPGDFAGDPDGWLMWERDDDGDGGWATSSVGCRLLSTSHPVFPPYGIPPVSYNAWRFRGGPEQDDTYLDEDDQELIPGRYQVMGNGDFDVGVTPETDFTLVSDWLGMLSTGPVPALAPGDTMRVSFALVCGDGQWEMARNAYRIAELEANDWVIAVSATGSELPNKNHLAAAVPNPFNPSTEIHFSLAQGGWTRLEVHGLDGRLVDVLVDEVRPAGEHRVQWQGRDRRGSAVASGMYLYRLTTPSGDRLVGHMTLVK
jgi:hypothetical protein